MAMASPKTPSADVQIFPTTDKRKIDVTRSLIALPGVAYALVFALEAGCFFIAAYLTIWVARARTLKEGKALPLTGVGL